MRLRLRDYRCYFLYGSSKWFTKSRHSTKLLDEYVREKAVHALEVREIPGILEKQEDPAKESARLETLSKGLHSLYHLRNHPAAFEPIEALALRMLREDTPFKLEQCDHIQCCGLCSRVCPRRCVQDVYTRLYMKCLPAYNGTVEVSEQPLEIRIALKLLLDPRATYEELLGVLNDMIKRDAQIGAVSETGYGALPVLVPSMTGKSYRRQINPLTGEFKYHLWPKTGLCPFCLPRGRYAKRKLGGSE